MSIETPTGPLAGIRIVDITAVFAGPYASALLGDLGADVVKIEPPDGDVTRSIGPRRVEGMSAQFVNLNRNKRSVAIDLKHQRGHAILMELIATADVFLCNMRPDALKRLSITATDITSMNPRIVYCSIVGFGPESVHRARPAIDDVIQAMSGIVSLQDQLTGTPSFVGMALADAITGLMALSAITAALYRREATGRGEQIEIPMYDAVASFVLATHMSGSVFEPALGPPIYPRSVAPNRKPFRTRDGLLCVAPYLDAQWRAFLSIIDRLELLSEKRFSTVFDRSHHLDELYAIVEPEIAARTTAWWVESLERADVPFAPVQTTSELIEDRYLMDAGVVRTVETEDGTLRLPVSPIKFRGAPIGIHRPPERLNTSGPELLAELGYSDADIEDLAREGVTPSSPPAHR